jgi:NitT/TauT family transport system permease protein
MARSAPRRVAGAVLSRRTLLLNLLVLVAAVAAWQEVVATGAVSAFVLPRPLAVWQAGTGNLGLLLPALWTTVYSAFLGLAVATLLGVGLAIFVTSFRPFARVVVPFAVIVRSVPAVAVAPVLTLLLGRGEAVVTVVAALICFFAIFVNVTAGLDATSREHVELCGILSASFWQQMRLVRLPGTLPYFASALRIAVPSAILGVLVAQWIATGDGLGYLILTSTQNFSLGLAWAGTILGALVGVLGYWLIGLAERRLQW